MSFMTSLAGIFAYNYILRGAGSKLKVEGHEFRHEAPEKNYCLPLLFCSTRS